MAKMFFWITITVSLTWAQMDETQGRLRFLSVDDIGTIDPITVESVSSVRLMEIAFGALYSMDRYRERIPEFADGDPKLMDNNISAIVKLKDNTKFSDGSLIEPEDIIFSWQAAINPGSDSYNRNAYSNIANISKLDDHTIRVDFNSPVTDARKYLRFFILPKAAFLSPEIKKELVYCREPDPVSGSFKLVVRSGTGREYHFAVNKYYTGKHKPSLTKLIMNVNHDIKAHPDNLRNEQVDLIPFVEPSQIPSLRQDSRFKLELYDSNQYDFIAFNFNNPILKLTPLRKAINIGFNREEILRSFFENDGQLMSGPFPPSHQGNNPDVRPWEFNREMAKTLLNNAGFIDSDGDGFVEYDGKPFKLHFLVSTAGNPTYNSIISSFIQQMKLIGLNIVRDAYTGGVVKDRIQRGKFDLVYYTRKVTPEGDYSPFFLSSQAYAGGKNIGYYHNALVDSQFTMSLLTRDFQVKTKIYENLHKILREDCPYVYLWYLRYNAAYVRRLKNVTIDPYYFFTTIEDWYYEDE